MEILRAVNDLQSLPSDKTTGWVGLARDKTGYHPGHIACIECSKANSDITVVNAWYMPELSNWWYKENVPLLTIAESMADEDIVITFCEENDVDYLFIPDAPDYFKGTNVDELLIWVESYREAEGYVYDKITNLNFFEIAMAMIYISKTRNYFRRDFQVRSWKEGYHEFLYKHFTNKYTGATFELIDPVLREDGLPYSSYEYLSEHELALLVETQNILRSSKDSVKDINYKGDLTNTINNIPNSQVTTFFTKYINVWEGKFLNEDEVYVEVILQLPSSFRVHNVPGRVTITELFREVS